MKTQKNEPMPQIISQIPVRSGLTREQWGAEIDRKIIALWTGWPTVGPDQAGLLLMLNEIAGGQDNMASTLLNEALFLALDETTLAVLDEIIIRQAVTLGWRLMTSEFAMFRFKRWSEEPFRPELFERLGKELAKSVRILSGEELPPIDDPGLRVHKDRATPQLKVLLREMRAKFTLNPRGELLAGLERDSGAFSSPGFWKPSVTAKSIRCWRAIPNTGRLFCEQIQTLLNRSSAGARLPPHCSMISWGG